MVKHSLSSTILTFKRCTLRWALEASHQASRRIWMSMATRRPKWTTCNNSYRDTDQQQTEIDWKIQVQRSQRASHSGIPLIVPSKSIRTKLSYHTRYKDQINSIQVQRTQLMFLEKFQKWSLPTITCWHLVLRKHSRNHLNQIKLSNYWTVDQCQSTVTEATQAHL
jgi:hypothetical protein